MLSLADLIFPSLRRFNSLLPLFITFGPLDDTDRKIVRDNQE